MNLTYVARRNLGAICVSMLLVTATSAQTRDDRDPRGIPQQNDATREGTEAAATQTSATPATTSRFQRERIENDERTSDDVRATNRGNDASEEESEIIRRRAIEARRLQPMSEFETFVSEVVDKPLRRFGSNLLVPTARDFTAPPSTTVPPDYRLNPGDEIVLGLSGSVDATDLRLTIDSQGRVFVPRVGAVNVAGVRFGDLQSVLSAQISRQYNNFNLSVGIGRLRGITVYVTGFAATPGSYTVSSLSTLVNAVLAAGGPSAGGSFRSIQLRRGGKLISDFDLYDLLLRGDKSGDRVLQNGDVIYLAPVGPQAAVIGSVNNEAIFEAAPGETVADLLLEAGGINTVADETRALLLDPLKLESQGWEELTPVEARTRVVPRAAIIRVLSNVGLAQPLGRRSVLVSISGEVAKPGRYYLPANTRLSQVLARAGGTTSSAYPFATVFTRENVRLQQRRSFERALRDTETALTVEPLTSALSPPGLAQERLLAARSIVAELRRLKPDGRLVLPITPEATSIPIDMVVENNDAIYIPPTPTTVGVFGAVPNPSTFYITGQARLRDYLARAGNPTKLAARSEIFVVRANGSVISSRGSSGLLKSAALPGDLIYVPINGARDRFFLKLREIAGAFLPVALTASAVSGATK